MKYLLSLIFCVLAVSTQAQIKTQFVITGDFATTSILSDSTFVVAFAADVSQFIEFSVGGITTDMFIFDGLGNIYDITAINSVNGSGAELVVEEMQNSVFMPSGGGQIYLPYSNTDLTPPGPNNDIGINDITQARILHDNYYKLDSLVNDLVYTFPTLSDLVNTTLTFDTGRRIKISDTGAEYLIQADSVAGYVTDEVAVVVNGSNYAVLQPIGQSYKTEWFKSSSRTDSEVWNKAGEYAFETTRKGIPAFGSPVYTDSTTQRGSTILVSQPMTITDQIYLYDNITYSGYSSQFNLDNRRLEPTVILDFNNAQDTAIVLINTNKQISRYPLNADYVSPKITNLNFEVISDLGLFMNAYGTNGRILKHVLIEGNSFLGTGIASNFSIFTDYDKVRIEDCEIGIHLVKESLVASTSISFQNTSIIGANISVLIDTAASTLITFDKLFIESFDSIGMDVGPNNYVNINNFESENSGKTPTPAAIFNIRGDDSNKQTVFSIDGCRLVAQADYMFDIHGASVVNIANGRIDRAFIGSAFLRTSEDVKALNLMNLSYPGGPLNISDCGTIPYCFGSEINPNTKTSIVNSSYQYAPINYKDELIVDSLFLNGDAKILLRRYSPLTPSIRYDNPSGGPTAPISLRTTQTTGPSFVANRQIELELYPRGNTQVNNIYSEILAAELTQNQTTGLNSITSELDFRNTTYNISTAYGINSIINFTTNPSTASLTEAFAFRAYNFAVQTPAYSVLTLGGLKIPDMGRITGAGASITNSYGILVEDQTFDSDNTYAIKTGTGNVVFGDSTYIVGNLEVNGDIYGVTNPTGGTNTVQASLDSLDQNSTWTKEEIEAGNNVDINGDSTATYSIDNLGSYTARVFDGVTASRLLMTPSLASLLNGTSANLRLESSGAKLAYGANEVLVNGTTTTVTGGLTVDNYTFNSDQDTTGLNSYVLGFNSTSGEIELKNPDSLGVTETEIRNIVSDSLADNRAVVSSSTAPDTTSVWVDDTDNTVKIRNGNEWMQVSPDRQFMTITDLLNNSNKIPFRLGETVEVMSTGATYEVVDINIYNERLGSLTEWPVDSLTSIQKGSKYLLMIPDKSGSFSFSNFIIDNSFDQTNKLQKAIDYVNRYQIGDRDLFASGASYTGLRDSSALVKRIPKTIYIDRQFEITNTIYLYDNVNLKGVNNFYANKSRKSTNIYANLNDSTKTAIEFRGTDAAINGDLSSHGTGIIEDVSLWATSSCYAIVNTRNASGAALKNISINGRDTMNTGDIVAKYGIITSGNIYFDIDNVQILNVDTAFYADVNEYISTSTTSFIRNLNIFTCNYGIVLTNFAFNQIEFENLTFDVINNVPFTMESGTFCVIDGMYLENSPDRFGTCPECPIFRVGTKRFASTPSLDATLVIENAYIQGGFDSPDFSGRTFIEADTVSMISVSSSWIRNVANTLSTTSATRSVVFSNVRDDSKNNLKEQLTGTADTDLIFDSTRVRVYALTGEISTDPFDWIYIEGDKLTGDIIAQDEVILENDKYLKGKQTGGTLSNLIGLQTDNSIVVGKGVSDVIRLAGTENDFDVYPDDDRIFSRVGDVDFSSNTAGNATFDFTNSNVASNSRSQISVTNGNATINMLAANQNYSILPWSNSGVISTNSSTSNGLKIRTSNGPISLTSGNLFESDITLDEGTVKFDKYADGNKVAGSLSKTQSQYYPVFATDGTILEEQITNPTGGTNTVQASLNDIHDLTQNADTWDNVSQFRAYGNGVDMASTVFSVTDVDKRNFNIHTVSEDGVATSHTEINLPTASATYFNHRITITSFDDDDDYNNVINGTQYGAYTLANGEQVDLICSLNNGSYQWYLTTDRQIDLGWENMASNDYTSGSPLVTLAGDTSTINFNGGTSINRDYLPVGVDSFLNRTTNTFNPVNVGDNYEIRVSFTGESSVSNGGNAYILLDIGGANPIVEQEQIFFTKGANTPQSFSVHFSVFALDTFITNGGTFKIESITGTTDIYDVKIYIKKDFNGSN